VIYAQTTGNHVKIGKIPTQAPNPHRAPPEAFLPSASGTVSSEDLRWLCDRAAPHSRLERELVSQHTAKHWHEQVITMAINF